MKKSKQLFELAADIDAQYSALHNSMWAIFSARDASAQHFSTLIRLTPYDFLARVVFDVWAYEHDVRIEHDDKHSNLDASRCVVRIVRSTDPTPSAQASLQRWAGLGDYMSRSEGGSLSDWAYSNLWFALLDTIPVDGVRRLWRAYEAAGLNGGSSDVERWIRRNPPARVIKIVQKQAEGPAGC